MNAEQNSKHTIQAGLMFVIILIPLQEILQKAWKNKG